MWKQLLRQGSRKAPSGPRTISVNQSVVHKGLASNYVSTTKYNVVTYLPKALFEQFRRVANIYFTLVAALSTTSLSPVSPVTTFLPLVIVLGISMVKEAVEDFKRYMADAEINGRKIEVWSPGTGSWTSKRWRDVQVGEVVRVEKDTFFPADLLLLDADNPDGICYVETMNLDGETNLKIKKAMDATSQLSDQRLAGFQGKVVCEQPNPSLYTFTGNLLLEPPFASASLTIPLTPASILLRGSSLRNTKRILGAVVFAGHETKVMKNATKPPSKRSTVERLMDGLILFMFALLATMCIIGSVFFAIWTHGRSRAMWYIEPSATASAYDPDRPVLVAVYAFVTQFILYGYLIPISLYVSLEMVKVVQSMVFIAHDRDMYHAATDTPALARTSNLNEELGMVDTILTDKTGTLTRNVMEFFKVSVAGVAYGQGVTEIERAAARREGRMLDDSVDPEAAAWKRPAFNFYDKRVMDGAWADEAEPDVFEQFLRCLAVCHTVIPDGPEDPARIKYEAESPDESALVAAAMVCGFFFHKRTNTGIVVRESIRGQTHDVQYDILNILEFDSTRKRMSIICRTPEGRLILYCKGADTVIYERLAPGHTANAALKDVTRQHMEEFGAAGLRTLCLSYVELEHDAYDKWQEQYFAAKTALEGRDEKLAAVSELIEKDLVLLGCTAIEDKLQAGVPETIERLANAGISIWVLTGDKQETAINIGFACSLLRNDMTQYIITASLPEVTALEDKGQADAAWQLAHARISEQLTDALKLMEMHKADGGDNALIIDGKALLHALEDDTKQLLLKVGGACVAVICCRVSPKQKALVTRLVKERGDVTLGIGDGANDVGMIQEAHIGVGISGQEGMQAVMSSDFAIAQFRFLETLLLVHGRWSYLRITRMVGYFFYKNLLFGLTIFFYNALCFFSGQILYNDFYMSLYNVIFTCLPALVIGTLDQDVSKDMSRRLPGLYGVGPRNRYFTVRACAGWLLAGAVQAGILFSMVIVCCRPVFADRSSGVTYTHWQTGSIMMSCVVVTVHLELAAILDHWTWLHHLSIWGSVCVWFLYLICYGALPLTYSSYIYKLFIEVLAPAASYWLLLVVVPFACVLPGFLVRHTRRLLAPEDRYVAAEMEAELLRGQRQPGKAADPLSEGRFTASARKSQLLARPSMAGGNTGFVPADAPGSMGHYTPRATSDQTAQAFDHLGGSQRHPAIAALDGEMIANPFRHRSSQRPSRTLVPASVMQQVADIPEPPQRQKKKGIWSKLTGQHDSKAAKRQPGADQDAASQASAPAAAFDIQAAASPLQGGSAAGQMGPAGQPAPPGPQRLQAWTVQPSRSGGADEQGGGDTSSVGSSPSRQQR